MSLKELIARDITGVFMNVNDFCDNLNIQIGRKKFNVIGSLQSNTVTNNSGNSSPLQSDAWVLYIKYPLLDDLETENILSAGQRIIISSPDSNIKDMAFTIVSVSDECGLATIQLSTSTGR
mgnify:CR=1 FL=1